MTSLLEASEQALAALLYEKDANAPHDWCHDKVVANLKQAIEAFKKAGHVVVHESAPKSQPTGEPANNFGEEIVNIMDMVAIEFSNDFVDDLMKVVPFDDQEFYPGDTLCEFLDKLKALGIKVSNVDCSEFIIDGNYHGVESWGIYEFIKTDSGERTYVKFTGSNGKCADIQFVAY